MKSYSKIVIGTVLSNLIGAFVIFFYFAYIDVATYLSNKAFWRGTQTDWQTFSISLVVSIVIGWVFIHRRAKLLLNISDSLQQGKQTNQISPRIQRLAAEFPIYVSIVSWMLWIGLALFFGMGGRSWGMTDGSVFRRTFLGIGMVGGMTISLMIYLFVEWQWRNTLPIFFPNGKISSAKAQRVTVGVRLILTFLLTGLVPLLSLGVSAQNSAIDIMDTNLEPYDVLRRLQLTITFIVGVSLVSNLILSGLMSRGLLNPLKHLTDAMNEIGEEGDLSYRVSVRVNDEIGDLTDGFNNMMEQLEKGQSMRDLFGRYVSKEIAAQVLEDGGNLGGVNSQATALFADIRDFTGLAERLPPEEVVNILNRYYTRMVDVVVKEGGIVNKFGGDSLLAIFGVPIRQEDHALRAVNAAWQMNRALAEFNSEQLSLNQPSLAIGIGISSGEVLAGNVGGEARLEYTIIGDPVNLASRLQDLTKEYNEPVLISQATANAVKEDADVQSIGQLTVKGKSEPISVFRLVYIKSK